jgi:hypothetical protein
VSGIDSSGRHPFSHRSFRHWRDAVIGGQRDRVVACTDEPVESREQRAKRTVQPNQHVLNLVAVGTEIVTDFVERREADPHQICRSHGIEPKARRDVERHPREVLVRERAALPLLIEEPVGGAASPAVQ